MPANTASSVLSTAVASSVGRKLTDPQRVVAVAVNERNIDELSAISKLADRPPWDGRTLSAGYPSVALLLAELSVADDAFIEPAHRYLLLAAQQLAGEAKASLLSGATGVALAIRRLQVRLPTGYRKLDGAISTRLERGTLQLISSAAAVGVEDEWGMRNAFDVISGLSGCTRYWVKSRHNSELAAACVTTIVEAGVSRLKCLGDTGMAHGLAGVLAALSIAWRDDVRVDGQTEVIADLAAQLWAWSQADTQGDGRAPVRHWPSKIRAGTQRHEHDPGDLGRWCYGWPGILRALQLATSVVPSLSFAACVIPTAERLAQRLSYDTRLRLDPGLCHGQAGVYRSLALMARDSGSSALSVAAESQLLALTAAWQPDSPFGFTYSSPNFRLAPDRPGFLEGAAGTALALMAAGQPSSALSDVVLCLD